MPSKPPTAVSEESGTAGLFALQLLALLVGNESAPKQQIPLGDAGDLQEGEAAGPQTGEANQEDAPDVARAETPEPASKATVTASAEFPKVASGVWDRAARQASRVTAAPHKNAAQRVDDDSPAAPSPRPLELTEKTVSADLGGNLPGMLQPPEERVGAQSRAADAGVPQADRQARVNVSFETPAPAEQDGSIPPAPADRQAVENFLRLWKTADGDLEDPPAAALREGEPSKPSAVPAGHSTAVEQRSVPVASPTPGRTPPLNLTSSEVMNEELSITYSEKNNINNKLDGRLPDRPDSPTPLLGDRRHDGVLGRGPLWESPLAERNAVESSRAEVWAERLTLADTKTQTAVSQPVRLKSERSTSFPQLVVASEKGRAVVEPSADSTASKALNRAATSEFPEAAGRAATEDDPGRGGERRDSDSTPTREELAVRRASRDRRPTLGVGLSAQDSSAAERRAAGPPRSAERKLSQDPAESAARAESLQQAGEPQSRAPKSSDRAAQPSPDGAVAGRLSAAPQPVSSQLAAGSPAPVEPPAAPRAAEAALSQRVAPPSGTERAEAALQVSASEIRRSPDATRLTLVLEDDRLGSLALRLAERGGGVDVMLRADNPAVAKQFQSNLPQLYESLLQRGLQPDARAWTPSGSADSDRQQQQQEHRERESRQPFRGRRNRANASTSTFSIPVS